MKRSSAVRHLVEMATVSTDLLGLRDTSGGWPVEQLWVAGDLLTGSSAVEHNQVVVVLDVPAEELLWLAWYPGAAWFDDQLRLEKRPFDWAYRALSWPVWNYRHRRLARFWSAEDGLDQDVINALNKGHPEKVEVAEPTMRALAEQLNTELPLSRQHLRHILEHYWDGDWRRTRRGFENTPEDHLWRAARAVTEMQDALDELCHAPA